MKKMIGCLIILFLITPPVSCGTSTTNIFDGNGLPEYPNEGYIFVSASGSGTIPVTTTDITSSTYNTNGHPVNYYIKSSIAASVIIDVPDPCVYLGYKVISTSFRGGSNIHSTYGECGYLGSCAPWGSCSRTSTYTQDMNTATNYNFKSRYSGISSGGSGSYSVSGNVAVLITTNGTYQISGTTDCIDDVSLYYNNLLVETNYSVGTNDHYTFKNLLYGGDYKLVFSNTHVYEFSPTTDMIYDHDGCAYYTLNLYDDCSNMLIIPYTTIYRNEFIPFLLYQGYDNPINLLIGEDIELGADIDITVHTCDGDIMLHDGYVEERVVNLFHQDISWDLDITCEDDKTGAKLQGVNVVRTQDCCIIGEPSGYALTQSNGKVCFTGLANSNIGVTASKGDYADYSNTISVGNSFDCQTQGRAFTIYMNATSAGGDSIDDFNNGTHNDSEDVNGGGETTLPSDHGFGCGVYFKNTDGYIVSSIYDTDAYVDMYWWVKNHGDGDSNLKFQCQIYTYWYDVQAYTVSNNTYERRRIYNTDFNDHTNSYRGYIYNETEGCNDVQILRVLNQTYEEETNYRNLTSHCHFKHKLGGNQIDYRSNVAIKIYANSDNSTLLNITANFMNGSTLEDSITYNWADFVNGDPKWWVVWEPDYAYVSGYNYTVNITGFDGYQLDTDEVWTADIVGSELTVFVKDNYNQQVTHSTVFVEDWGSISTGDKNYVSIAGFPQGTYQYKATKSGYISSGWASVEMDNHESVTCILVSETQTSITASKMTNAEIKAFFIPLMYLLFIMMLLGAFKFACGGK